ncbi:MAG: DUF3592 domain-containing protein, partial [Alphaproteobacteria bacterium]|nr:DUF3592 domain-containing protein [Alphaproteobacteria bacterium]
MRKTVNWLFLLFIGIGSLFLAVGGGIAWYNYRFIASALTAEGTVIEVEEYSSSDGSLYRPVVRFKTSSGEEITMRDSGGSNPPLYDQGETVTVYYAPGDPRDAKLDSWITLWVLPGFFGGLGFMFAVIPALIWNGMRRAAVRREELKISG